MIVYWNLLLLFPNLIKLFQQDLTHFIKQTNAYKVNSFICDSVSIGISLLIPYRNQPIDLLSKLMHWSLYNVKIDR